MKALFKLLKDESGASAAEYALILTVTGSVIVIASLGLSNAIGNAMGDRADCVETSTEDACEAG